MTAHPSPAFHRWPRSRVHFLLLLTLCGWLFFLNLGGIPFLGKDEPKNAEATREMMVRGDWVTTTLFEEPWFDKPILYYWVSLVFFHLLGPGEAAARLGSALFGTATVLLTWWFARRVFGPRTALRSGVILATGLEFFWFSRTAVVDLPLTFFVTLALVSFYLALEDRQTAIPWYLLAFAAAGGATLSKGPVGIILSGLVVGAYLLAGRRLPELARIPWVRGIFCFGVVAVPWHAVVMARHGWLFWDNFILNRNIDRYLTTLHQHPGPVYYYVPVLIIGIFPWGALLPFALGKIFSEGWRDLLTERRRFGYLIFWVLLPLLFFSFAGSKLPSYMLPSFPALAILLAWGWEPILELAKESGGVGPWTRRFAVVLLLLLFPILAGGIYFWCSREAPDQIPAQTPLMMALGGTAFALGTAALMRRRRLLFPLCTAGTIICLTVLLLFSLGDVKEKGTLVRISRAAVQTVREGTTVVAYRNFHNNLFFYTENLIPYIKEREDLDRLLRERGTVACLVEARGLRELAADPALNLEVLDRQNKVTLARIRLQPPPEEK